MNLSALVSSFSTGTYTVTRRAQSTFVDGMAVAGATSSLSVVAAVHPATGQDLLRLPEGRRTEETRIIFTSTPLMAGHGSTNKADLISIEGRSWEVQSVETWTDPQSGDSSYRCIAQAVD